MGEGKNSRKDKYMVLIQASEEDFAKYPKSADGAGGWRQDKKYFSSVYGKVELSTLKV